MTDCIGLVYVKNDIKLLGPIVIGVVCDKIRQDNNVTSLPCVVYAENEIELSSLIESGAICHENQI